MAEVPEEEVGPEPLPLVLSIYWSPGEYVEVDQGEMQDWEAIALLERTRRLIEDAAEVEDREEQE